MSAALALAASLLWGTSDFVGGTLGRRLPTLAVLTGSQLLSCVPLVAWVVLSRSWHAPPPGPFLAAAGAGMCWMAGLGCFYTALARGTMGVVAPVAAAGVVVPVAVGVAAGERPGGLQAAGIVLAVLGVLACAGLGSPATDDGPGTRAARGPVVLALLAAACFGLELSLLGAAGQAGGSGGAAGTLLVVRVTAACCAVGAGIAVGLRRRTPSPARLAATVRDVARGRLGLALVAVAGLDLAAMAAFTQACAGGGGLALVAVLASVYPAVTVLLARRVHRERLARAQTWGVLAALGGVALIAA